jgi:pyruvate/2-oxoglutarate dehydrogenase complex dihydrolipoamide acyltransferase (E2) component
MSETLLNEIRATRPEAPSALRERVRALRVEEPVREPLLDRFRFTWGWRRLVLVAPATVLVALVSAGVIGLTRDDTREQSASDTPTLAGEIFAQDEAAPEAASPPSTRALAPTTKDSGAAGGAVAPAPGQLQRFEAELSLRVDDVGALSDATKQAQQIARDHGGSVSSLSYDAPSQGVGAAQITLRIPTAQVEGALTELSQLGTIVGQRYGIQDLQQQADSLQTQIEQTQRRIAQILAQLGNPALSDENRVVLQSRLTSNREKLTGLREAMKSTRAEAATSTVYVSLTTEEIEATPVGGSRLDDVKDVLAWEAIALLYVLVVVGPFVVVGIVVWLLLRLLRRRETARLLEQN